MISNDLQSISPQYDDLRDLLVDCYGSASRIMIDVYNKNPLQVYTGCLFIKVLNSTRALLLLFENNLLAETYILLRHQMEIVFILRACSEDKSFLKEYIDSDARWRLRLANVICGKRDYFDENDNFDLNKIVGLRSKLKSIVDENDIREMKVEELARKAKMEEYYDTAYRLFSNIAHVGVKSLDDHLVLANGKIKELSIYPYQEDIPKLFVTAIELILLTTECVGQIFEINLEEQLTVLRGRLNTMQSQFGEGGS